MKLIAAASLVASLVVTMPVDAYDGKLAGAFSQAGANNLPTMTYYDAGCSVDERAECVVTSIFCENQGLGVNVLSVDDETLGAWLSKLHGTLTLKARGSSTELSPTEMTTNDMDGGWDIKFVAYTADQKETTPTWFARLGAKDAISIITPRQIDVLPVDGDNGVQFNRFLTACRG